MSGSCRSEDPCYLGSHSKYKPVYTLKPWQNGCHFANDIFKFISLNENCCILIQILLKFVPKGLISNKPAMVLIMAWHWAGDKPLSELMHICITRPPQGLEANRKWPPFYRQDYKCIFLSGNGCILIKILLRVVFDHPVDNYSALA